MLKRLKLNMEIFLKAINHLYYAAMVYFFSNFVEYVVFSFKNLVRKNKLAVIDQGV